MPCSQARLDANQNNAASSSGPKTEDGKLRSRANALKHGQTGAGIVLPEQDAAEVDRLTASFQAELKPSSEVGEVLVRRMAVLTVRMERCVEQQSAAVSERVRQAMETFEAPEGMDVEEANRRRIEIGQAALFDPSREACLARKYEAAAERGFLRSLKELRQLQKPASQATPAPSVAQVQTPSKATVATLGSFLQDEKLMRPVASKPVPTPAPSPKNPQTAPTKANLDDWDLSPSTRFDIPMAVGLTH